MAQYQTGVQGTWGIKAQDTMLYIFRHAEESVQILPVSPCRSGIGPYWTALNRIAILNEEADKGRETNEIDLI